MNKLTYILALFLGTLLLSCGTTEDESVKSDLLSNVQDSKRLMAKIDSLEKIVYDENADLDNAPTAELMAAYNEYTQKFIGDKKKTPEYLYKSAAISRAVNLPVKAIKLYDKILADYPDYERNPEVAFLMAFTYDEDLKQKEQAKEAYHIVIERYPGDKWAEQASARLENIDQSDEDLVKSFMEKDRKKSE
ncbi:tetratricopeptide repeat protein [Cryomorpha ignava]|uniref:Tetratricopeptide repeat protein n=1 Tax=Cryomorpha ignava TaxID=101383 RepID=A0A7K3WRW0_9FLAO|nr:tetratricopeptide repeat protein [Cryomorpha ignava]NEN24407.1 tetratricopeptide repeat protein [Cryomorpha ignava]